MSPKELAEELNFTLAIHTARTEKFTCGFEEICWRVHLATLLPVIRRRIFQLGQNA
jgi:hypothetical protein